MTKKLLLTLALVPALAVSAFAQTLDWKVDFEYFFHNKEFTRSYDMSEVSETSNAARLTPSVGVRFQPERNFNHQIMLGVDIVREMGFGVRNAELVQDLTLYYNAGGTLRNGATLEAVAGAFPRSFAEGDYRRLFWSYDNAFFDPNLEGFFVKYRSPRFYAELGLDWFGQSIMEEGPWRRDHFQVISSLKWQFAKPLTLGMNLLGIHYADFQDIDSLVDQDLLSAWLLWTPRVRHLDLLEIQGSFVAAYQNDRGVEDMRFPCGLLLRQKASLKGFGAENFLYCGSDLQPFRERYPADLYPADRLYHMPASAGLGWNDEIQVFYSPAIAKGLHLAFVFGFQFGSSTDWLNPADMTLRHIPFYRGCRQMLTLKADLCKPGAKPRSAQQEPRRQRSIIEEFFNRQYEL